MTRHERRRLKKLERERAAAKEGRGMRIHGAHIVGLIVAVSVVGAAVYGVRHLVKTTPPATYTAGPVHWHAKIELSVCGEARDLPGPKDGRMVGNRLYHHHGDNTWHIEDRIISRDDIKLGRFFDEHEIPFDRDRLMEKRNGDSCKEGGPAGQVKMFVNGAANSEFRDFVGKYTPNAADTVIKIVFE